MMTGVHVCMFTVSRLDASREEIYGDPEKKMPMSPLQSRRFGDYVLHVSGDMVYLVPDNSKRAKHALFLRAPALALRGRGDVGGVVGGGGGEDHKEVCVSNFII